MPPYFWQCKIFQTLFQQEPWDQQFCQAIFLTFSWFRNQICILGAKYTPCYWDITDFQRQETYLCCVCAHRGYTWSSFLSPFVILSSEIRSMDPIIDYMFTCFLNPKVLIVSELLIHTTMKINGLTRVQYCSYFLIFSLRVYDQMLFDNHHSIKMFKQNPSQWNKILMGKVLSTQGKIVTLK